MFDPAVFKGSDKDSTVQRIQAYVVGSCKDVGFYLKPTSSCKQYKVGRLLAVLYFASIMHHLLLIRSKVKQQSRLTSRKRILPKA